MADNIIDHNDISAVPSLPQSTFDAIGQQKWFFTHASVGGNIVEGLNTLHTADPSKYQLVTSKVTYDSSNLAAVSIASTTSGTVYECDRGNPGPAAKFEIFDKSVRSSGWHSSAVSIAMDKLCYIDQDADVTAYLNSMAALESACSGTTFVYTTMPLTIWDDGANVARNTYNAAVRDYCRTHDKFLFDIADIEAWDPLGNHQTYDLNGKTYDRLYSSFSDDSGHLNAAGQYQVALGWYAMAAQIVDPAPEPASALLIAPAALLLLRRRRTA